MSFGTEFSLMDTRDNTFSDEKKSTVYNGSKVETVSMTDSGWKANISGYIDTDHSGQPDKRTVSCQTYNGH